MIAGIVKQRVDTGETSVCIFPCAFVFSFFSS